MREFLQGPNASLDKIEADLTTPSTQELNFDDSLSPIMKAISDARLEFTLNLDAMATSSEFRQLDKFVRRTRDAAFEIISEVGDVGADIAPLEAAQTLLGSIRGHITVRETIESGGKAGVPNGAEIAFAKSSFADVGRELKDYEDSLDRTFAKYRRTH